MYLRLFLGYSSPLGTNTESQSSGLTLSYLNAVKDLACQLIKNKLYIRSVLMNSYPTTCFAYDRHGKSELDVLLRSLGTFHYVPYFFMELSKLST